MHKLLSIPDFARATGLSYWLARELVLRGDVPSIRVGNRRRVSAHWVAGWVNAGESSQHQDSQSSDSHITVSA